MTGAVLGFVGSMISFILWMPQAKKVWNVRKDPHALKGVSIATQVLVIINALVWFAYAFVLNEFWVGAAGFINLPLAILTILLIAKANKLPTEEITHCPSCGFHSLEPHMFFVTTPPGWGSVYPCPQNSSSNLPPGVGVFQENVPELRKALRPIFD